MRRIRINSDRIPFFGRLLCGEQAGVLRALWSSSSSASLCAKQVLRNFAHFDERLQDLQALYLQRWEGRANSDLWNDLDHFEREQAPNVRRLRQLLLERLQVRADDWDRYLAVCARARAQEDSELEAAVARECLSQVLRSIASTPAWVVRSGQLLKETGFREWNQKTQDEKKNEKKKKLADWVERLFLLRELVLQVYLPARLEYRTLRELEEWVLDGE